MSPIIRAEELKERITEPNLIIIDAQTGSDSYETEHINGALHVDLEQDLSEKTHDPAKGGRHPLPDIKKFSALLGKLGITPDSHVVVYDSKKGLSAAPRFWWMLKSAGHIQVQVLNGGLAAAKQAGIPVTNEIPKAASSAAYPVSDWKSPIANLREMQQASEDSRRLIIDAREGFRFRGESEPIDLIAGHIPNSINIPFISNLDSEGFFLPPEKLAEIYKAAIGNKRPEDVIVYCGSGVTACHSLLAMEYAGIKGASLYGGSWSEWSRNNLPVAKEIE